MELKKKIETIINEVPGTFGIAIKHLETGEQVTNNENELFQLASCFKVPVMATLFRDTENGKIDLKQRVRIKKEDFRTGSGVLEALDPGAEITVKGLAMLMIIVSDNVATDILMEMVGIENVDNNMKELGFENISVKHDVRDAIIRHMGKLPEKTTDQEFWGLLQKRGSGSNLRDINMDNASVFDPIPENNVSTPTDMCNFLEMIARKQLISEAACEGMFQIMSSQKLRNRIPYLLPAEAKFACKTGTVGSVANDVGIVYLPEQKGSFVIVAFSRDNTSTSEGDITIARIAETAYEYFLANS